MKFRKGNKQIFFQDMNFWRGVPHGIDFNVERFGDESIKLTADGYGNMKKKDTYGNGAILMKIKHLTKKQQDILRRK